MPDVAWFDYRELRRYADIYVSDASGEKNVSLTDSTTLQLRQAYYCSTTWTDALIGSVLTELNELGLADNTVISFFGDHGYILGEHTAWNKHSNFELAAHAPMMISIPGLTNKGLRSEKLTEFVDLYPTLVEAAGLKQLPVCPENSANVSLCREGSSLMPLIKHPSQPIKKASFWQYPRCGRMGYTIRTDRFRYTEWPKFSFEPQYKTEWENNCGVELYDHLIDREENYNHAYDTEYKDIRNELSKMLRDGWRKSLIESNKKE
jgi:iduronate 2-sulfatase